MDFLSVTKYITLSVIYDLKACHDVLKKMCFDMVAMVKTQGLLLPKHGKERNYKTKHRMFKMTIVG